MEMPNQKSTFFISGCNFSLVTSTLAVLSIFVPTTLPTNCAISISFNKPNSISYHTKQEPKKTQREDVILDQVIATTFRMFQKVGPLRRVDQEPTGLPDLNCKNPKSRRNILPWSYYDISPIVSELADIPYIRGGSRQDL